MIITKTPLRISFVGGGSDLPAFYREEPGAVVSATIDKYVYVTVSPKFDGAIRAAYSVTENVGRVEDLQHDLIRETLLADPVWQGGVEIHSIADIPGGTGLGSSSAFTVGLVKALYPEIGPPAIIARHAAKVEIDRCHHPIGKQDQYAAAFGGLNLFRFLPDETVQVESIACDYNVLDAHLLLFYTGNARQGDAGQVLAGQQQDRDDVRELVALVGPFAAALEQGNWRGCGAILDMAWHVKRRWVSDNTIDHFYLVARQVGAWGGKLCGAGGGGFLLFMAPPERHEAIIRALDLRHVPIAIEPRGSQVVYAD